MTSRGQTPYPISTIFNRLPEGTIGDMLTMNEDAALKTVDAGLLTDRHTDKQTNRYTDMTNYMIVAHRRWATIKSSVVRLGFEPTR